MSLPNLPRVVQVNWDGRTGADRWDQPNANILTTCLRSLKLTRHLMLPTVEQDTAVLVCEDLGRDLIIGASGSVLYPNVTLDPPRACRVMAQNPATPGDWYCRFMGYLTAIEPDPVALPRYLVRVTVDAVSTVLAQRGVTPTAIPTDGVVYDPADPDHSALTQLLLAAGLYNPTQVTLEAPRGAPVPLPPVRTATSPSTTTSGGGIPAATTDALPEPAGPWGGAPVQFGQALSELLQLAGAAVEVQPQYATTANEPDWVLRWWVPLILATPDFSWSAAAGDLWLTPRIQWAGEAA